MITVGCTFRVVHYSAVRSLWIDEARLAINILSRTYGGLAQPLDYDQAAPVVFLWLEKCLSELFGASEPVLRLLPFMAGVLGFVLTYPLARRFVSSRSALLALAMSATGPFLIYYANEVKPYGLDMLVAITLTWLGARWLQEGRIVLPWALLTAGTVAVWISMPAPFVLAGIVAATLMCSDKDLAHRLRASAVAATLWGLSFAAAFSLTYGPASKNPFLRSFWAYSMLDPGRPDWSGRAWQGIRDTLWGILVGGRTTQPLDAVYNSYINSGSVFLLLLGALGAFSLVTSTGLARTMLLVGPLAALLGAAVLGAYPVACRLMLFAAPLLQILVAAGANSLVQTGSHHLRAPLWGLAWLLLLANPMARAIVGAAAPASRDGRHREAIRAFERLAKPDEPVYVSAGSIPPWVYYTTNWNAPDSGLLQEIARLASYPGVAFENGPPRDTVKTELGDGLTFITGRRASMLGLYTGLQVRSGVPIARSQPDPGWYAVEAERIRRLARPSVWVILSHMNDTEPGLYRRLHAIGGRLLHRSPRTDTPIARYIFE